MKESPNELENNIAKNSYENNLAKFAVFYLAALLVILSASRNYHYLNRFPWTDLIWGDMQVHNPWRWFTETLKENKIIDAMSSTIDFRENTGENIVAFSRSGNQFLDFGNLAYFFTGSENFGFYFKFVFYAGLTCLGIFKLMATGNKTFHKNPFKSCLQFAVFISAILWNPIFYHEIGFMTLWHLFLIPLWLFVILEVSQNNKKTTITFKASILLLILLTLGAGDLFIPFTYSGLFVYVYVRYKLSKIQLLRITKLYFLIITLYLANYAVYFYNTFFSEFYFSDFSAINLKQYLTEFILPLLSNSILFPRFIGPFTFYQNILIFFIFFLVFKNCVRKRDLRYPASLLLTGGFLLLIGIILHWLPVFRSNLPGMFRYHLAIIPILFISTLALEGQEITLWNVNVLNIKNVSKIIILTTFIPLSSQFVYTKTVPVASLRLVNSSYEEWLSSYIPNCIDNGIKVSEFANMDRSFVFASKPLTSYSEDLGRNDLLSYLLERPESLYGRTFNQWRYSTNLLNHDVNIASGTRGVTSWPLSTTNLDSIKNFLLKTNSSFLISSVHLIDMNLVEIGKCNFPNNISRNDLAIWNWKSKSFIYNSSLFSNVYLYGYKPILKNNNHIKFETQYFSSKIKLSNICRALSKENNLVLPINYNSDLRIRILEGKFNRLKIAQNTDSPALVLKADSCSGNASVVEIYSKSSLNFARNFLLVFLLIISILLIIYNKVGRIKNVLHVGKIHF